MKTLAEFDCMVLRPRGASAANAAVISTVLPKAKHVKDNSRKDQLKAVKAMRGAYLLVLPAFVIPNPELAHQRPDALLLDAGYRLAWMSRNAVTGELTAKPCPSLWLRSDFIEALSQDINRGSKRVALMPDCLADWAFNTSSGAAFKAGMAHVGELLSADFPAKEIRRKLLIAATIGQDAPYCDWWQLGVMRAILGAKNTHHAYQHEKDHTAAPGMMRQRLEDLLRQLRNEHNLDAYYIDAKKSRFFKMGKFLKPRRAIFDEVAAQYKDLGQAGATLSQRNIEAADWIWGAL